MRGVPLRDEGVEDAEVEMSKIEQVKKLYLVHCARHHKEWREEALMEVAQAFKAQYDIEERTRWAIEFMTMREEKPFELAVYGAVYDDKD